MLRKVVLLLETEGSQKGTRFGAVVRYSFERGYCDEHCDPWLYIGRSQTTYSWLVVCLPCGKQSDTFQLLQSCDFILTLTHKLGPSQGVACAFLWLKCRAACGNGRRVTSGEGCEEENNYRSCVQSQARPNREETTNTSSAESYRTKTVHLILAKVQL